MEAKFPGGRKVKEKAPRPAWERLGDETSMRTWPSAGAGLVVGGCGEWGARPQKLWEKPEPEGCPSR